MKHIIESEKLGTIGEESDAEAAAATGINVAALLAGGFISIQKAPKSAKTKSDLEEK